MSNDDLARAREQALAQYAAIAEMVKRYQEAEKAGDDDKRDEIREEMEGNALSVSVRDGWYSPGSHAEDGPEEFEILLCTGGPAVRIHGQLSGWHDPEDADLEYQDWFQPWTVLRGPDLPDDYFDTLLAYCRVFWFGE